MTNKHALFSPGGGANVPVMPAFATKQTTSKDSSVQPSTRSTYKKPAAEATVLAT